MDISMDIYKCANCKGGVCSDCHEAEENAAPTAENFISLFMSLSESGKKLIAETIKEMYKDNT